MWFRCIWPKSSSLLCWYYRFWATFHRTLKPTNTDFIWIWQHRMIGSGWCLNQKWVGLDRSCWCKPEIWMGLIESCLIYYSLEKLFTETASELSFRFTNMATDFTQMILVLIKSTLPVLDTQPSTCQPKYTPPSFTHVLTHTHTPTKHQILYHLISWTILWSEPDTSWSN